VLATFTDVGAAVTVTEADVVVLAVKKLALPAVSGV
jgi:hypothetical protein